VAGSELVEAYFSRALPSNVTPIIVAADQVEMLLCALQGGPANAT
jgi:hypothetical protein